MNDEEKLMEEMIDNATKFSKTELKADNKINEIKKLVPKFSHNSRVEIIQGFYKGYTGIVKEYVVRNNLINYKVELVELDSNDYWISENELRLKKKFLGLF